MTSAGLIKNKSLIPFNNHIFFSFLLLMLALCGCNQNTLFEKNTTIYNALWNKFEIISFDVNIEDTSAKYNFFINVRNKTDYDYANLYLFMNTKYPSGDIEIISVQDANANGSKYFKINAKVTLNSAGPCPERMHIFFNYPEQNFVSQPPEYITKDCKTCVSKESCPILFPEEAIIASHTFEGTEEVQKYVNEEKGIFSLASEKEKSWLVTWDSPFSSYYYEVEISKNASVLGIKKIPKED